MSDKNTMVIMAPVATRSGYGERSRDLVRALIALDKFDIKIVSTRWGQTPMNALSDQDQDIVSRIVTESINQQPDIFIQVTIPNEFQRAGKFNIGITAGIESDSCAPEWLEGCNKMDLILVSSEHSKKVLTETKYNKMDNNTKQNVGTLQLEKPIEVLFEGVDLNKYFKTEAIKSKFLQNEMSKIKEDFCFLFVGHWLQGELGQDRKNVARLIHSFLEAFKNKQTAPALILKTSAGSTSKMDVAEMYKKIEYLKGQVDTKILPNIYVISGDLEDSEMNELYNHPKVKVHVSLTRGEGYGRPLAEASMSGKPMLVSGWSGQVDFLNKDFITLVPGTLIPVHSSVVWDKVLIKDSKWFEPDYGFAIGTMKDMFKNYKKYTETSRKHTQYTKTNFSWDMMKEKLSTILTNVLPTFPKHMAIALPKLKKMEEPVQIQLPKLKKVEATPKLTLPKLKKVSE
jgi:hypothetical protein